MRKLIAGSRGSKLALVQTENIIKLLGLDVEVKVIQTRGDKITDVALARLEGKAFFTKELDDALLDGSVDFAVHSYKDIPTDIPEGLVIAAVPPRESPLDALVGPYADFESLPHKAKVGTSSLRRRSETLRLRQDVAVEDLRGNLDTRMRKLSEGQYDAIIVAEAGLKRLGYTDYHALDPEEFIPAAGQGALAITARADDKDVLEALSKLDHSETRFASWCEREFLSTLEGGCQVPAGVYTQQDNGNFIITGFISSLDGRRFLKVQLAGPKEGAGQMAVDVAKHLLRSGGDEILKELRTGAT